MRLAITTDMSTTWKIFGELVVLDDGSMIVLSKGGAMKNKHHACARCAVESPSCHVPNPTRCANCRRLLPGEERCWCRSMGTLAELRRLRAVRDASRARLPDREIPAVSLFLRDGFADLEPSHLDALGAARGATATKLARFFTTLRSTLVSMEVADRGTAIHLESAPSSPALAVSRSRAVNTTLRLMGVAPCGSTDERARTLSALLSSGSECITAERALAHLEPKDSQLVESVEHASYSVSNEDFFPLVFPRPMEGIDISDI